MTVLPPPPYVPETQLRRLALRVSHRLDGLLQGDHPRTTIGPGSEPAEARPYLIGEDARRIDWAVTARTGQTHLRTTRADRELETTLVVDLSPSLAFGSRRTEKRDLALAVGSGLVHLSSAHGDRVGALILTADGRRRVPARAGREAALGLQHILASTPRQGEGVGASLAEALMTLTRPPSRRGLVVVISDLLEAGVPQETRWARPLRLLTQRSDVVVAQVQDPREHDLPAVGTLQLVDPETGRLLEVRTTAKLRARYAEAATARADVQRAAVKAAGAGHVIVRTDRDWLPELAQHLSTRCRTVARPSGAARV
jgi:uncharacterized protein (DUF58 family)